MTPPARWRRLLSRVLPDRDRDVLMDEMDRLHGDRVEREGPGAAASWYRAQVLAFVARYPAEWGRERRAHPGARGGEMMRQLRYTVRGLLRAPGFTVVAVLTLGLGIGANAIMLGLADRALLRPLPFPDSGALVSVLDGWLTNLGSVDILQREMEGVEALGAAQDATGMTLEPGEGPARRVTVARVSPEYLEALQVTPALGRLFRPGESAPGAGRVALVGSGFWRASLGGDPAVLERSLVLDGERFDVVGVLPDGFDLPSGRNEIWLPVTMDAANPGMFWGNGGYSVVARMADGVAPERLVAELQRLEEPVRLSNPLWTPNPGTWSAARVVPLQEARGQGVRGPLLLLLGAAGVVLLVVCANLANLLLSRGLARSRENAVRVALGAGRGRLVADQFLEVAVLSAAGMLLGLLFAAWGLDAARPHLPPGLPGGDRAGVDLRIILATGALAFVAALAAGLPPALRGSGRAPGTVLREAGRGGGTTRSSRRMTRALVAAQLAAAVVLVTSAGLLSRSLWALGQVDPGFEVQDRITARVHLPPGLPGEREARAAYLEGLQDALEADPSLARVALAATIPFGGEQALMATMIPGVTEDPNELPLSRFHQVSASWFAVSGIPLRSGRLIQDGDRLGSELVAVVDETFAARFFPGEDAVGRVVRYPWRGAPDLRIVGVVGSVAHGDLSEPPEPTLWVPLAQMGTGAPTYAVVVAQVEGDDDERALGAVLERVRTLDDRMAVSDLSTYEERLGASLDGTRILAVLLVIFAVAALALGCVGVYGVAAFFVRDRLREIGVRMAMGAPVGRIRRRVLREGMLLVIPGGVAGLLLSVPATRALEGFLFGVPTLDPLTFAAVPFILVMAALTAVYLPARRATRVDPATILREG